MSCKKCEEFQKSTKTSYIRIDNANVEIRACEKHLKIVFAKLNNYNALLAACEKIHTTIGKGDRIEIADTCVEFVIPAIAEAKGVSKMKTIVWVQTLFEGWHRWVEAPDDVAFLRDYHRHIFEVKLGVDVSHDDRDVEFFQLKRKVDKYIGDTFEGRYTNLSCEMIAKQLLDTFNATFVEVSEDGENGATVSHS